MAGIPLKSGADFYVLEAARMRLHNLGADPTEYGDGLIYFNNSDWNNTSRRARIYDGTAFRSLAYLDEIANNEAFNALVGRVDEAEGDITSLEGRATSLEGRTDALEALFSGSNAKVADNALMLGGQLPSYYAQSSVLAQLRSEFDALYKTLNDDTTGVIDTWQEVVDFVNEYSGSEDLSTILAGMNTQIADRYTKAEADGRFLKLTGGKVVGDTIIEGTTTVRRSARFPLYVETVDTTADGVGIRFRNNGTNTIGLYTKFSDDQLYRYNRALTELYTILDTGNYSDLITTLNKKLSVPRVLVGGADDESAYKFIVKGASKFGSTSSFGNVFAHSTDGTSRLSTVWAADVVRIYANNAEGTESKAIYIGRYDGSSFGISKTGHVLIGTTEDNSERLQVNGTSRFTGLSYLNGGASIPTGKTLKIGSIVLSDDNGTLKIEGSAYATGELAAGGAGEEGSDDMGLALLENWADYDATKAQALGAVLGKDMYDRIVTLEGKSTNVQFTPTLSSGKQIGAITIDGVTTGIFAPSSYAWSEIDGRPTSLSQFTDDVVAGNYLPVSGGTMGGILTMNHVNASDKVSYIIFKDSRINSNTQFADYIFRVSDSNDSWRGGFGLKGDANEIDYYFLGKNGSTSENNLRLYSDRAAWGSSTILHSGNVGEYNSGGMALGVSTDDYLQGRVAKAWYDWNANTGNGAESYSYGIYVGAYDTGYGMQLATTIGSASFLRARVKRNSAWENWKTIAFTDSDITGNAATATKLKDAVSLWGNEFDGTQDLTGTMTLDNQYPIRWKSSEGSELDAVVLNSTNNLLLGQGVAKAGFSTYIYGYNIRFCYGSAGSVNQTAMTITEEGNMLVGTTTGEDVKFTVNGGTSINLGYHRINSADGVPTKASEINPKTTFSLIRGYDRRYGLHAWLASNASVSLQSSYANQTSDTCYTLNLNPLGGAVNIGSTSGNGLLTTYGGIKLAGGTNYQKIQSEGTMVIGVESGRIDLSAPTEIDFITHASNILFNGTALGPWTQYNNVISLGRSNARWGNVYSVGGDFSGRVLIGGAEDDGISALQWAGTAKTINNTYGNIEIRTARGLSWHAPASISSWTRGLYAYDNSSPTPLGIFGFKGAEQVLEHAFIGNSATSPWLTINSTESNFKVLTKFNGGALIPTGQSIKIGEATLSWDADKNALKVDKNIYSDGEVSAGGAGEEGESESTGNASAWEQTFVPTNTTMPFEHNRATTDVIVQVYEKNDGGSWDMILVDVEIISETKVNLHFGRTENREHKIVIMG